MKLKISQYSIFMLILLLSIPACAQKETVKLSEISKEIVKMRDLDQKMRVKWAGQVRKGKDKSEKFREFTNKLIAIDRQHTARMREIIAEYGWPTFELVGKGPSNSAWLIIQHADRNPLFQAKCLPLLKEAVDNDQANASNYAYLYDRVHVAKGEKQLYATQSSSNNGLKEGSFYPIAQESEVQVRREEMNISRSVEEYASSMGFEYKILSKEEAARKATESKLAVKEYRLKALEAIEKKDYSLAAEHYLKLTEYYGDIETEDFVEAARMLSLAKHEDMSNGIPLLTRALVRGWDGIDRIKKDSDFENLRNNSAAQWEDFLTTVAAMELDR